jgi:hypothetical protein
MFPGQRYPHLILVAMLVAAAAVFALVVYHSPALMQVFDPRSEILSIRVLRSPKDHFHVSNQMEGCLRDSLRGQAGLTNVAPLVDIGRAVTSLLIKLFARAEAW